MKKFLHVNQHVDHNVKKTTPSHLRQRKTEIDENNQIINPPPVFLFPNSNHLTRMDALFIKK